LEKVLAHGTKPTDGGIAQSAGDSVFELATKDSGTEIYIADHGIELPTAGATSILTVLKDTEKTGLPRKAGANNIFRSEQISVSPRGDNATFFRPV
jgi:hypothetical protein